VIEGGQGQCGLDNRAWSVGLSQRRETMEGQKAVLEGLGNRISEIQVHL